MTKHYRAYPEKEGVIDASPRLLYDRREAARMLSISVRSLDYLISQGRLRTRRIGGRVLVPHNDLVRFAERGDREPMQSAA